VDPSQRARTRRAVRLVDAFWWRPVGARSFIFDQTASFPQP
jgi:hypothetical protein